MKSVRNLFLLTYTVHKRFTQNIKSHISVFQTAPKSLKEKNIIEECWQMSPLNYFTNYKEKTDLALFFFMGNKNYLPVLMIKRFNKKATRLKNDPV